MSVSSIAPSTAEITVIPNPDQEKDCPICLSPIGIEPALGHTATHPFHTDCLRKCLERDNKCPVCRIPLSIPQPLTNPAKAVQAATHLLTAGESTAWETGSELSYWTDDNFTMDEWLESLQLQLESISESGSVTLDEIKDLLDEVERFVDIRAVQLLADHLNRGSISALLPVASENENAKVVSIIIQSGEVVASSDLSKGVKSALENSRPDIAIGILQNGPIHSNTKFWAANWALQHSSPEIMLTLFEAQSFTSEEKSELINKIAEVAPRRFIRALIHHGIFNDSLRNQAIVRAASYGRHQIVVELLASGPISEDTRGRAVIVASPEDHFNIVATLLHSGPISTEHRSEAYRSTRDPSIRDLLSENSNYNMYLTFGVVFLLGLAHKYYILADQ